MRLSYPYFMAFRLVLATFIQLWNLKCSSSIQLTFSVHFVTLVVWRLRSYLDVRHWSPGMLCASVTHNQCTKHEMTPNRMLANSARKLCLSWKTSFFLIFVLHTCTFRSALQNLNLLSSMLPDKPIAALIHLSLLISVIRISSSLLL